MRRTKDWNMSSPFVRITGSDIAPEDRARQVEPLLQRHQCKEEAIERPRPKARVPPAREHGDDCAKQVLRRIGLEEKISELRRIEADDEPSECAKTLPLPLRERLEAPRRKIVRRFRAIELDRGFDSGFHRDRNASRENGIEKRARVAREN